MAIFKSLYVALKLRALLLVVSVMISFRSRSRPDVSALIAGKDTVLQTSVESVGFGRFFEVSGNAIVTRDGTHPAPSITINFESMDYVNSVLGADSKPEALMVGVQQQKVSVTGDSAQLMWWIQLFKVLFA